MNFLTRLNTETKIKLGLIIVLIVFTISLLLSFKATPASIFFPLKRIQEKIFLKFKSNPESQVEYLSSLLNIRLDELRSMAGSENHSYILSSSLRYSSTAGDITRLIKDNKLGSQTKIVVEMFNKHKQVLLKVLENYPKDLDTERKYVEDDINYLSIYIDQLSKSMSALK